MLTDSDTNRCVLLAGRSSHRSTGMGNAFNISETELSAFIPKTNRSRVSFVGLVIIGIAGTMHMRLPNLTKKLDSSRNSTDMRLRKRFCSHVRAPIVGNLRIAPKLWMWPGDKAVWRSTCMDRICCRGLSCRDSGRGVHVFHDDFAVRHGGILPDWTCGRRIDATDD